MITQVMGYWENNYCIRKHREQIRNNYFKTIECFGSKEVFERGKNHEPHNEKYREEQ